MNFLTALANNSGWIIGTLLFFFALLGSAAFANSRYKKVPPSKLGILYGRKRKYKVTDPDGKSQDVEVGFRLLTNGGSIVIPILESYVEMNLGARLIPLNVADIPTQNKVSVAAQGTATVSIGNNENSMITAARRFQGHSEEDINNIIKENLEGQLRSILGTLTIEELISEREKLNEAVLKGAEQELLKLGMEIQILTIQGITDRHGYIEALGQGKIAEVKRDAKVREAEATRDSQIASSNALKEAELIAAQNNVLVAAAQKERDVQVAQFKATTDKERALADQAGALAAAGMDKQVRQAKVEAEAAETMSRIALAEQEILRVEKELQFTQIKPAEAARQAAIINANASKQSGIIRAEQDKEVKVINANAEFDAAAKQADAVRIQAEAAGIATQKRGEGEAAAKKAVLIAEAEGRERDLIATAEGDKATRLAFAEGERARLIAEADGKEKLAEALKKLDDTGKLLQILDQLPEISTALGNAMAKALGPEGAASIFGQMALPMGNIDSIHIVDVGGNGNASGNGISKFASTLPNLLFQFLTQSKALGFDLEPILNKLGLNSDLLKTLTTTSSLDTNQAAEKKS